MACHAGWSRGRMPMSRVNKHVKVPIKKNIIEGHEMAQLQYSQKVP